MDRKLVIIGGVVTAVLGTIGYVFVGNLSLFYAAFGGGLAIGLQSGNWNDEMILGGVGAAFGAILLLLLYIVVHISNLLLNFTDGTIALLMEGLTFGFSFLVLAIVPFLVVGAIGGYTGRWIGYRAKLTPDVR